MYEFVDVIVKRFLLT